jgi:hypothetical protein
VNAYRRWLLTTPGSVNSTRMTGGILNEAYERFHCTGPEWGEDQLTNHGPMAAEVLVRRGHADTVPTWVGSYIRRLDELPRATDAVTEANWRDALGDGARVSDWTAYFSRRLAAEPWRDVLATWWPRLLPGILAGTTHGVIRTGHVVRALLAGAENEPTREELAHALAFWAARVRSLPPSAAPAGTLDALTALDGLPRIPDQRGNVAHRLGQLAGVPAWQPSVSALRAVSTPEDVRAVLTDLVTAATMRYLRYGHGQPVLLVHTATAPNAVLHTLPALPVRLWAPSLSAVWTASAAMFAAYAPAGAAAPEDLPQPPSARDAVTDLIDRAVAHGDEHVIKFTDTAAEVYTRTGRTEALAAAVRIGTLIPAR